MTDLLLLLALPVWLYALYRWREKFEPDLVLAPCLLLERLMTGPEPEPEPARLRARDLTVADTGWATKDYPTVAYELVRP